MAGSMKNAVELQKILLLLLLFPLVAIAETLPDPTRPPGDLFVSAGRAAEKEPSGLQSVIIAPGRRAAIINGQTVELGDKIGDERLIEVDEHSVVLRGKQGRQVLTMFPEVKMKKKTPPVSLATDTASAKSKSESKAAVTDRSRGDE